MSTNSQYKTLLVERYGKVTLLTINRPDKLNALNEEVLVELKNFLKEFSSNSLASHCGLVLTGAGEKSFIAGADIAQMQTMGPNKLRDFGELGQKVTTLFENLQVPVIAAVGGFALGGGLEMALACDFIFATENAKMGLPEVKLGLIPGFGGTQRLSRIIGRHQAKKLIYSAEMIDAQAARALGLCVEIFPDKDAMLKAALAYLENLSQNSAVAIQHAKQAINMGVDIDLTMGLKNELDHFLQAYNSEDAQEGLAAFVEKRSASFKGQ